MYIPLTSATRPDENTRRRRLHGLFQSLRYTLTHKHIDTGVLGPCDSFEGPALLIRFPMAHD
jgi:hypothetical protein